jgi:hypothetical protein
MMSNTTWMDAQQALAEGFIDGIVDEVPSNNLFNCVAPRAVDRKEAEVKVQAWLERSRPQRPKPVNIDQPEEIADPVPEPPVPEENESALVEPEQPVPEEEENTGTPVAQLHKRLDLIMPVRR